MVTSTGGVPPAAGGATGGTTASRTGGTTGTATAGTTGTAAGGTTGTATGGTTASRTGGTTGTATGGTTGTATAGTTGTATAGTTGTAGSSGGYAPGNPAVPSAGCGTALSTFKSGANTTYKMTSATLSREYIMYIPSSYDAKKPYRLIFNFHCMGSSDTQCANSDGYYWLKAQDTGNTSIFVAPQGYTDSMPWRSDDKDHTFFDDMLKQFKSELCIDESRVFSIGFSFGGMETYSLSVDHQKDLRAAVGIAPANYNIYVPTKTHQPIAWMQTTGMSDTTCPWVNGSSTTQGSKYIAIEHGTDNGCTVPSTIPTWTSGNHLCVDFTGCKAGYPTKICTFNGPHTDNSTESGTNWIPTEAWKFITQF
jgi:poly(3-hydroxybutyrate) depolymerase